jgi:hypothetical protein
VAAFSEVVQTCVVAVPGVAKPVFCVGVGVELRNPHACQHFIKVLRYVEGIKVFMYREGAECEVRRGEVGRVVEDGRCIIWCIINRGVG